MLLGSSNNQQQLNVTGWEGQRNVLLFDVTNVSHGGNTARIAGKRDGSGNIQLDFDAGLPIYAPPFGIQEGVSGVIFESVSPLRAIQTPVILEALKFVSQISSQLKYNFDWKMNTLAGLFVYPAA